MTLNITGISQVNLPAGKKGITYLARFDLEVAGLFRIENCLLVETEIGRSAWTLQAGKPSGNGGVRLAPGLRAAVTEAASNAYDAFMSAPKVEHAALSAAVALVREVEARA